MSCKISQNPTQTKKTSRNILNTHAQENTQKTLNSKRSNQIKYGISVLYNPISWVKENIKSMKAKALLGRITRNIKLQA